MAIPVFVGIFANKFTVAVILFFTQNFNKMFIKCLSSSVNHWDRRTTSSYEY